MKGGNQTDSSPHLVLKTCTRHFHMISFKMLMWNNSEFSVSRGRGSMKQQLYSSTHDCSLTLTQPNSMAPHPRVSYLELFTDHRWQTELHITPCWIKIKWRTTQFKVCDFIFGERTSLKCIWEHLDWLAWWVHWNLHILAPALVTFNVLCVCRHSPPPHT